MINSINQQPIRKNVAFTKTKVSPNQCMISINFIENFFGKKVIDYGFKQAHVFSLLLHALIVFFEFRSGR